MDSQRIGGIALLIIGVILFVVGINASDSLADQWSDFFTGHFTDTTMWYMIGGVALTIVGLMLVTRGGRTTGA